MNEILTYLKPLLKWWWLLLLAVLLAGGTSYTVAVRQPREYQTKTTLLVGKAINEPNPTSGDLYLGQQLASIYADMANREPVKQATMQTLKLSWLPDYVSRALPNTQLLEIVVTDTDPNRAQAVANELAHQLILQTPTNSLAGGEENKQFIEGQLVLLRQQIKDTQAEIAKDNLQMGTLNSARQIADLQTQISGLETKVTSLQSTYASLLSTTNQNAENSLTVVEAASLPTSPISSNLLIIVALASLIALVLASLGAYLIEALDDSVKDADDAGHLLGGPILGRIPKISDKEPIKDYVFQKPNSPFAEAFRMLRTNLEFLSVDRPIKTIQVTGVGVSEGKSTIASNLALSLAQSEKQVIVVDADFRRPAFHPAADASANQGLSDVLRGSTAVKDALIPWVNGNVRLLPSGNPPPNPTELLGSKKVEDVLAELANLADYVIIDSPPLMLPDSFILSSKVDGVISVIQLGRTQKKLIQEAKKQFIQSGSRFLGGVINRVHPGGNYYYHYYSSDKRKARSESAAEEQPGTQIGQDLEEPATQDADGNHHETNSGGMPAAAESETAHGDG